MREAAAGGAGVIAEPKEKAGAAAEVVEVEVEGAGVNEKPVVILAGWFFASSAAGGGVGLAAPKEKPVDVAPEEPIDEPKAKPVFLAAPADVPTALSLSFPCRPAPKPKVGGEEAPKEVVMGGEEAGLTAEREEEVEGVEKGVGAPPKSDLAGVEEEGAPKGFEEVEAEAKAPVDDAEVNENAGFFSSTFFSSTFSAFFSFSPFAMLPKEPAKLNPPAAGFFASPSFFSGLVGGLTLWPNLSGEGFAGGLVSFAGASFGAEGGLKEDRSSALAGAEEVGKEKALFSA